MAKSTSMYSLGDRIIHRSYGVGQIESIDHKPVNGVKVECFKVKTEHGYFWFPTESTENPRIHPVAPNELLQKALKILRSPPQELELDPLLWQERIDEVQNEGDLLAISLLVRDLAGLKTKSKLQRTQETAFSKLKVRLLREWAAIQNVDPQTIQSKLRACLRKSNAHNKNPT